MWLFANEDAVGIIPAYAGSTKFRSPYYNAAQDHPRIRGEHTARATRPSSRVGSSPHTRGAPSVSPPLSRAWRIIPAYAGSTRGSIQSENSPRDHPRIRGEHLSIELLRCVAAGSSPHTRGALVIGLDPGSAEGIIPAYAGSTPSGLAGEPAPTDHPRIRGEHLLWWWSLSEAAGSSPHTRGARGGRPRPIALPRIIPAYAGSTACSPPAESSARDHPRIRGEHAPRGLRRFDGGGSSPHTRGAHQRAPVWVRHHGIIPAYAGSTNRSHPL